MNSRWVVVAGVMCATCGNNHDERHVLLQWAALNAALDYVPLATCVDDSVAAPAFDAIAIRPGMRVRIIPRVAGTTPAIDWVMPRASFGAADLSFARSLVADDDAALAALEQPGALCSLLGSIVIKVNDPVAAAEDTRPAPDPCVASRLRTKLGVAGKVHATGGMVIETCVRAAQPLRRKLVLSNWSMRGDADAGDISVLVPIRFDDHVDPTYVSVFSSIADIEAEYDVVVVVVRRSARYIRGLPVDQELLDCAELAADERPECAAPCDVHPVAPPPSPLCRALVDASGRIGVGFAPMHNVLEAQPAWKWALLVAPDDVLVTTPRRRAMR